jgi:hypothetical protein
VVVRMILGRPSAGDAVDVLRDVRVLSARGRPDFTDRPCDIRTNDARRSVRPCRDVSTRSPSRVRPHADER